MKKNIILMIIITMLVSDVGVKAVSQSDCKAGTYYSAGKCVSCPDDEYQPNDGQISCYSCDASCRATTSGRNCDVITGKCNACEEAGYYIAGSTCKACPAGSFSVSNTATSCTKCQPGEFQAYNGATYCNVCQPGEYQPGVGQSHCYACSAGTYNTGYGSTSCTTCPAGTYNSSIGSTSCTTCEVGYYCTGGTNKTACPAGYTSDENSTSESDCEECKFSYAVID